MPFTKVGKDDYTSPKGNHFNGAQVRLYYANGEKFPGQKKAAGGPVEKKKGGLVPGKVVNPAPKIDMKGIVKGKGQNLAGTPRSAGLDMKDTPNKKGFDTVVKQKGQTRDYHKTGKPFAFGGPVSAAGASLRGKGYGYGTPYDNRVAGGGQTADWEADRINAGINVRRG